MLTPIVVVFLLVGCLGEPLTLVKAGRDQDPCLTDGCIITAGRMLESQDESVQPCDDFYLHTCNNWIKANQDPVLDGYSSKVDQLTSVSDLIDNRLKKLLEQVDEYEAIDSEMVASEHDQALLDRLIGTAKDLYAKCLKQGVYCDTNLF